MTITRIHGSSIATQSLRILSDYAYLSDDSNFSRRISQIAPEEIPISSEERKNSSEESNDTSEESDDMSEEIFLSPVSHENSLRRHLAFTFVNLAGRVKKRLPSKETLEGRKRAEQ